MKEFLEYPLFEVSSYSLKVHNLLSVAFYLLFSLLALVIIKKLIYRSKTLDRAKKFSINKLIRYVVALFSIIIIIHLLGFNVSVLLAGSAALLVGLGFGLQNLFNDFISGVILLMDGTLKIGDIIEVNSMIYKVQAINFRTTTVIGRDENYVIMPNSELTGNRVVNWTHNKIASRFKIDIGVEYSTDVNLVMKLLKQAAASHSMVLKDPEPIVRFEDYGDSALIFSVYFFTNEIFRVENTKSEIRVEIFRSLGENDIHVPFPQRVVHMRP